MREVKKLIARDLTSGSVLARLDVELGLRQTDLQRMTLDVERELEIRATERGERLVVEVEWEIDGYRYGSPVRFVGTPKEPGCCDKKHRWTPTDAPHASDIATLDGESPMYAILDGGDWHYCAGCGRYRMTLYVFEDNSTESRWYSYYE